MEDYLKRLKEAFSDLYPEEARMIVQNGLVFEALDDAHDFMRIKLGMNQEAFKVFLSSDEFTSEWDAFCAAESQFIKGLK